MTDKERKEAEYDYLVKGLPTKDSWQNYGVIYFDFEKEEEKK